MAQYKVPQDVEAEDKLLGPFTFRQFIYLLIAAAGIAGAWGLFQIFPLLALIPIPFVFFFGILALPIKKDQPMETYLAAVVSFYMKPNRRVWMPGQRESTIKIIAPKKVEKSRTRDITEDEASHRLSFLATIVDTEGYAIRGDSSMKDEYAAEADTVEDVLAADNPVIDRIIEQEQTARKQELVSQMRTAMNRADALIGTTPVQPQPVQPQAFQIPTPQPVATPDVQQLTQASLNQAAVAQQFQNLANNKTFSIQTIAQQANRIQQSIPQPVQPQPQPQIQQPQPAPSQFEQEFMQKVHNPYGEGASSVEPRAINNAMVTDHEAGLTAPQFTPMSAPLPHKTEIGGMYHPVNKNNGNNPDRPDLYGPPTAIFSS